MNDDLVKRARDVLNGTTPEPWYIGAQNDALYVIDGPPSPSPYDGPIPKPYGPNVVCTPEWRDMPTEKNARFIAAARSLVPEMADAIEALQAKLHDMHRRAQTAEAALREPIEAAAPERRTLGRVLANAAFYAEHDRAEALQAQLAEARDDAAFVAAQLQAVLDMSPPPQEVILKKRLHELAARKNALAEARDKALEDAAMLMQRHGFGGSAAAIRAMKGERG